MELITHGLFALWSSYGNGQPSLLTRRTHPSSALPICWSPYTRAGLGSSVLPENVKDYRSHCPTLEGKRTGESGRGNVGRRGGRGGEEKKEKGEEEEEKETDEQKFIWLCCSWNFFSFLVLCFLSLSFYDSNTLLSFFVYSAKLSPRDWASDFPRWPWTMRLMRRFASWLTMRGSNPQTFRKKREPDRWQNVWTLLVWPSP